MRKHLCFLMALLCFSAFAIAQNVTVTGRVTDTKDGAPISGVSVTSKQSKAGVKTDIRGNFSIPVPFGNKTLVFSFVGYGTQEVTVGASNYVEVRMLGGSTNLNEVVVIGYGTQRRREVTGNLSSVSGASVAEKPIQSFESGLAGKAPGVQITTSNGLANNPPVFRIRGTNSISLSSYPLIVVDGVPTYTGDQGGTSAPANPLASINPNDIESIDIAKDAAASAIYGSRAANGVVFITTKKGRAGKAKVSYDGWVGWTKAQRLPKMLDAFQYTDYKNVALANAKANNPAITGSFSLTNGPDGQPINTNWNDYIYRTGLSHSHNVNVSGGSDNTNYYFSAGYTNQEGMLRHNDFKRINALMNVDSRVSKIVTIGGKLSYSNEYNLVGGTSGGLPGEGFAIAGAGRIALVLPSNISPYNNDGTYNIASGTAIGSMGNIVNGAGPVTYYNPVMVMNLNRSNNETQHLQSNVYLQLRPVNGLSLRTTYGVDNLLIDNDIFYNPFHGDGTGTSAGPGGGATGSFSKAKTWLWTNTAQYDLTIAQRHTFSALIGNEQQRRTSNGFGLNRRTLSDSAYTVIQAGYTTNNSAGLILGENYLLSNFARLNYNFDKKYFLSGNIRRDEYSALGVKAGVFYGFSAGWEVTKEKFWTSANLENVFSSFKLRGSFGKVGNFAGIGNFATYSTYGSGLYGGVATLSPSAFGNPDIKWETSTKTDLGFNFGFFKDRLTGDFAYYFNNINNLILNVPQSPSTGLPSILQNVGSMYNKGLELSITAIPVQTRNFTWSTTLNITYNKNKVTGLANGITEIINGLGGGTTEYPTKTVPDYSIGQIWAVRTAGVDPATGRRIFLNKAGTPIYYEYGTLPAGRYNWSLADGSQYAKTNADGTKTPLAISQSDDALLMGNTTPKYYGGWDNSITYKNFTASFTFTYQLGNYIYYGTNAGLHDQRFWNNSVDILNYWQAKDQNTNIPKPVYNDNVSNGSSMPLDINVFKGDFAKLRTLQIGYSLPQSLLGRGKISSARIYASGQNLLIITKYPGSDPEVSTDGNSNATQGVDRNTLPNARTLTVGLNLSF